MTDKLRAAAELALEQVQEFKRRWWLVPAFGNKVNKATREAITNAHSPIFALEHTLRTALAEKPAEQEADWEKLYRLEVKKKDALAAKYERDTGKQLTRIVPMAEQPAEQSANPVGAVFQEPVYFEVRCEAHPEWMRVDHEQFEEYTGYGWQGRKLYAAPQPKAKQEPVAWMWKDGTLTSDPDRADGTWTPLYTAPQPAIPPGYKLVPVEPTQAMLEAAHDAIQSEGLTTTTWLRTTCYRAMLNAAPESPQPAKQPAEQEPVALGPLAKRRVFDYIRDVRPSHRSRPRHHRGSQMNIIELAREAGLVLSCDMQDGYIRDGRYDKQLERFATLIRNATLDEAAGVCDREAKRAYQNDGLDDGYESGKSVAAKNCADAIRQLKETK